MKSYRDATYATSIITVITAFMTICLHYWGKGHEAAFWNNVALTLFGGAVITLITSVIGYWRERTLALEKFSSLSQKIIGKIRLDSLTILPRSISGTTVPATPISGSLRRGGRSAMTFTRKSIGRFIAFARMCKRLAARSMAKMQSIYQQAFATWKKNSVYMSQIQLLKLEA